MILLKILLWLLLILLALILLILAAPITYQASGRAGTDVRKGEGQLSLFWGLIRLKALTDDFQHLQITLTVAGISKTFPMTAARKDTSKDTSKSSPKDISQDSPKDQSKQWTKKQRAAPSEQSQEKKKAPKKSPREKPTLSFSQVLEHLRDAFSRELMAVIRRFLRKIWKALRPQVFHVKVVYGLPDPYETAMINNGLMALFAVWPHRTLQLQPVFHDSLVDVSGNIKGSLVLFTFLAAALQLVLAKPVRRIWWPLLKQHFKRSSSSTSEAFHSSSGASST
ncbi:MAG: hypothetical protein SCK57_05775 [Bacillota bacterium]|nr:hypothetical protein [Bacillota bacterium]MDW7677151.1 hypothetical protein [Bacillota bacterium]